jgi:anti-sigma regulatory factor (Ser/Thr protein kinase)
MAFIQEPAHRARPTNGGGERGRQHRPQRVEDFSPVAASVRQARRHVREALRSDVEPEVLGAVELLVSELATNAILHAGTPFAVHVGLHPARVRVEVHDQADALPTRRDAGLLDSTARGINIVEAFADRWGSFATPSGKAVWFELDR